MFVPVQPPAKPKSRGNRTRLRVPLAGAGAVLLAVLAAALRDPGGAPPGGDGGDGVLVIGLLCGGASVVLVGVSIGYWIHGRLGGRGWRRAWEPVAAAEGEGER